MLKCENTRPHCGLLENTDAPHVLWLDYRLDARLGVIGIKHGPSAFRKRSGETVEALEGRVLAQLSSADCGAVDSDLRSLSAPPVSQNGKGPAHDSR